MKHNCIRVFHSALHVQCLNRNTSCYAYGWDVLSSFYSQVSGLYLFYILFLMHKLVVGYNLFKKKDKLLETVHKGPCNVIYIFKFSFRFTPFIWCVILSPACEYVRHMCTGACRGLRKAFNTVELYLWMFVSQQVSPGTWVWGICRRNKSWVISPDSGNLITYV